ncbi:MAG: hypothetical protein ACOC2D_00455 [Spirochaetota bacterium]
MRHGRGRWKTRAGGIVFAVSALLAGCTAGGLLAQITFPVAYRSVGLVAGDRGALHETAGLYVELANVSERTITGVELAFDLYRDGEPLPAAGANSFSVLAETHLAAGDTATFCVSLDTVAGAADEGVAAHRVRARTVTFSDGTRWVNPGGHVDREEAS